MSRSNLWKPWGAALALGAIVALGGGWVAMQNRVEGQENDQARPAVKSHQDAVAVSNANSISRAFRQAASAARPSVVKILAHTNSKQMKNTSADGAYGFNGENPFKGTPFEKLFPDMPGGRGQHFSFGTPQEQPERDGLGSGVIIDASGIVLTNNHVVRGADEVTVVLKDGREFKATDIKTDPASDLAVLRLQGAKDLPAAKLGNSDQEEVGDWVIAIGCPFGLEQTVSAGIISGKGRELESNNHDSFLQTDAAINPGNSGGPLVNLDGEVIGINTAIATNSGGYEGIGFSIPINTAKWVVKQLLNNGHVQRAYLGVQLEELNGDLAKKFGTTVDHGVLVADVVKDSPAAAAGLHEGDVIVSYEGQTVHNPRELRDLVEVTAVGSTQSMDVLRDGKTINISISPKAMPAKYADNTTPSDESQGDTESATDTYTVKEFGLTVGDMTSDEAKQFDGQEGVVIREVAPDSPASQKRLEPGMLIRKVGQTRVKNVQDFEAAMKHESPTAGVMYQVRVGTHNLFVVLEAK